MNTPGMTEWQTLILGPYSGDVGTYTFPCLPQVRGGRTKLLPTRATLGPPDPDRDDTLSTVNFMDLSGGQGVAIINPSSDLNRYWWGTADARYADGWTCAPEAIMRRPDTYAGNCTPIGRIGASMYALWGTDIHQWNADDQTWGASLDTVGTVVGDPVIFNNTAFFPLGSAGYAYVSESTPGTLGSVVTVTGAATPTSNDPLPTSNPRVQVFGIHQQKLWALTTAAEGNALCSSITGATGAWSWPYNGALPGFVKIDTGFEPHALVAFLDAQAQRALWLTGRGGALIYNAGSTSWEEAVYGVPPHPNFGVAALPFRNGEAIWITAGGGDMLQYTNSNVAQPGQGPGGRDHGMPATKRGDIVSLASDLANMYALVQGDTSADSTPTIVEDSSGSDPLYVPDSLAVSSLIAYNGKGWHPLWETSTPSGAPTRVVVGDARNAANAVDYRVFWGVGEECWCMPARLTMYSARQGRERGIDRFATDSYIEWGEFDAGSIANKKLFSHAAILLDHASAAEYVEIEYQRCADPSATWHQLGSASTPQRRTVLPFGLSDDGLWADGLSCYWIKPRMRFVGPGAFGTPTVQAFTLAYMPLAQDSGHEEFIVPLPVEVCPHSGKTREQIIDLILGLLSSETFLQLTFLNRTWRVYVSGVSLTEIAGQDFQGTLNLSVLQIPTGLDTLLGEGIGT